MSVKALRNQLLAAIAMVLVAAIALGSSTFAWFASNNTVTAKLMKVTVKSNDTYLLISATKTTAAEIQSGKLTADEVNPAITAEEAEVFPAKPKESSDIGTGKAFADATAAGTLVSNATTAAAFGNWYTANNGDPANAVNSLKQIRSLTDFDDYVVKRTVYLTLAAGSDSAHKLTVTPTFTSNDNTKNMDAVKVLVATGDNYAILTNATNSAVSLYATDDQAITDSNVITVDIYIYYDGSVSSVYTNNKANLTGATVNLQFDVETGTAS